ncbi:MAG: hypothetical protein IJ381_01110 [Clostridia bacterium]|nr:hypothetical protein [Clostridia bacterium]
MQKKIKRMWKALWKSRMIRHGLILLPGLFALIGYYQYYNGDLLFTLFSSIKVYAGSFDATFGNLVVPEAMHMRVCLEIARWGGLCVTGTFLFGFFKEWFEKADVVRKTRDAGIIAVHGSAYYKNLLQEEFGKAAIVKDFPEKFKARRHILAFETDHELLQYLNAHFSEFPCFAESGSHKALSQVYLCLHSAAHTKYSSAGFMINNMSEDCARLYWKQNYIRRYGEKTERRIVLIGFGHYGQALLSQALLVNVFAQQTPGMEYHVFGDSGLYRQLHRGIEHFASVNAADETGDSVIFHEEGWQENMKLLSAADRIILCDDTDEVNIHLLGLLTGEVGGVPIHIRCRDIRMLKALYSEQKIEENDRSDGLCVFGTDRMLYTHELILDEALMETAKMMHARYLHHGNLVRCVSCHDTVRLKTCVKCCRYFEEDWNQLGVFLQRSNICAADHLDVKLREVLQRDCEIEKETIKAYALVLENCLNRGAIDRYLELEHRRWMRFHFFWGWEYADIPKKDKENKKHPLLLPYDQLSDAQKSKDMDAYMVLTELYDCRA